MERKIYHIKLIYGKEVNYDASGKVKNDTSIVKLDEQEYQAVKTSYPGLGVCMAKCIDIKGIPTKGATQAIEDVNTELVKYSVGVKTVKPPIKIEKVPEKITMYIDGEVTDYDLKGLLKLANEKGIDKFKGFPVAGQLKDIAKFIIELINTAGGEEPVKPAPAKKQAGRPGKK